MQDTFITVTNAISGETVLINANKILAYTKRTEDIGGSYIFFSWDKNDCCATKETPEEITELLIQTGAYIIN